MEHPPSPKISLVSFLGDELSTLRMTHDVESLHSVYYEPLAQVGACGWEGRGEGTFTHRYSQPAAARNWQYVGGPATFLCFIWRTTQLWRQLHVAG